MRDEWKTPSIDCAAWLQRRCSRRLRARPCRSWQRHPRGGSSSSSSMQRSRWKRTMTRRPKTCALALLLSGVEHPTLSRSFISRCSFDPGTGWAEVRHLCRRCPRKFSRIPDCHFCTAVADSLNAAVLWCFNSRTVLRYHPTIQSHVVGSYDGTVNCGITECTSLCVQRK